MDVSELNIAVIGAGVGGLAAAIALRRKGAKVTVYEQAPAIEEVGAGIQLAANGLKVLSALADPSALLAGATRPAHVALCDHKRGTKIAKFPLDRPDRPYAQVHRSDLIDWLQKQAKAAGAEIRCTARVNAGDLQAEGADLVVAADGMRSQTRQNMFGGTAARFTGQVAWRALVKSKRLAQPEDYFQTRVTMGPGRHLVTYPLRLGELINLVAVKEHPDWIAESWNNEDDPKNLAACFAGWSAHTRALTEQVKKAQIWGLYDHAPLAGWYSGNVVLLGDAAHPMLPFLGQGANMALEDAWVLADQLARHKDVALALHTYQDLRKPRATRVQQASKDQAWVYHMKNPLLRAGLHVGMKVTAKVMPGVMTGKTDWIYSKDVTAD